MMEQVIFPFHFFSSSLHRRLGMSGKTNFHLHNSLLMMHTVSGATLCISYPANDNNYQYTIIISPPTTNIYFARHSLLTISLSRVPGLDRLLRQEVSVKRAATFTDPSNVLLSRPSVASA
jgi:hypothetical protein